MLPADAGRDKESAEGVVDQAAARHATCAATFTSYPDVLACLEVGLCSLAQ